MNTKEVIVRCTDGTTMRGKINIGDKNTRLSDYFSNNQDPFITLFDATSEGEVGKVIILNKDHLIWVVPIKE